MIRPLHLPALQYQAWYKTLFRMIEAHELRRHDRAGNDNEPFWPRSA